MLQGCFILKWVTVNHFYFADLVDEISEKRNTPKKGYVDYFFYCFIKLIFLRFSKIYSSSKDSIKKRIVVISRSGASGRYFFGR